ncbi:MAG: bifunctional ADP-dependent NAD(P)H-hydrate dehydratase/NAD(P)H-hydrate epimerase, partial [Pseudonocardia sp.]|nr:bifunctional ADP-dependent NAD(P)H-hydrate dehydratase/NAD(P)H-hydrate epimerase [Pseudonocardia sp.]
MDGVWTADQVRAAERELMATVPDGTLMRRAAFGLAVHARRMLAATGPVTGARVALLVGAGDNGGDAL